MGQTRLQAILMTLLGRVDIGPDRVEVELLDMQSINPTTQERKFDKKFENVLRLLVRTRLSESAAK